MYKFSIKQIIKIIEICWNANNKKLYNSQEEYIEHCKEEISSYFGLPNSLLNETI